MTAASRTAPALTRTLALLAAALLALPSAAHARPRGGGAGEPGSPDKAAHRERMLKRMSTLRAVELGDLLELDTTATVRLAERLEKFDEQRRQLQLENLEAMRALRRSVGGGEPVDAAALARKIAANRVQLAQLDQRELEDTLAMAPRERAAEVTLFLADFRRRVERMADKARGEKGRRDHRDGQGPRRDR